MLDALFGDYPKLEPTFIELTEWFMDWQWDDYLSVQVPQEYFDELDGVKAGGLTHDIADLDKILER